MSCDFSPRSQAPDKNNAARLLHFHTQLLADPIAMQDSLISQEIKDHSSRTFVRSLHF